MENNVLKTAQQVELASVGDVVRSNQEQIKETVLIHNRDVSPTEKDNSHETDYQITDNLSSTQSSTLEVPHSVSVLLKALIERHAITREQLLGIYDEYAAQKLREAAVQAQAMMITTNSTVGAVPPRRNSDQLQIMTDEEMTEDNLNDSEPISSEEQCLSHHRHLEEGETQVGKMQNLVRSALENYSTGSCLPATAVIEIGKKRPANFTLEEELRLQPSEFAQQLLERDQTLVAQAIKRYMNQYSIPQREVVEKTALNQSHLSQHFLHGVTMKRAKRIKLYHWFEEDQKVRTGKLQSADGSLNAVLESPKVDGGSRRRPRWKWSPISTQILTEAFKKNQFPTREQRVELSRVCNDAEIAMNNGAVVRGPEGDTEGITEQRVNTWFTNRRKGLTTPVTPSPTRAMTPGSTPFFAPTLPPTLLKATPATTPVLTSGHSIVPSPNHSPFKGATLSLMVPPGSNGTGHIFNGSENKSSSLSTVQTLVSQIQQAQVNHASTVTSASGSQLQSPHHVTLPLAIALPGVGASQATILNPTNSSSHSVNSATTPMQAMSMPTNPTLISSSQMQAILSQLHGSSALQFTAPSNSSMQPAGIITLPVPNATSATVLSSSSAGIRMASSPSSSTTTYNGSPSSKMNDLTLLASSDQNYVASSNLTLTPTQVQALMNLSKIEGGVSPTVATGTTPQLQFLTLPPGMAFAGAPPGSGSEPTLLLTSATTQGQHNATQA